MIDLSASSPPNAPTPQPYDYQDDPPSPCASERWNGRPDIGVVVTAFNGARFLKECVDSILGQDLPPERLVIVDDFSESDNTLAVARSFEQFGVKVLRTPKNLGMCGARTLGLQEVFCPVIMCFDGDDIMPPKYLSTMRRELGRNGFVYPGRQFFGTRSEKLPAPEADRANLWKQNFCPSPSLMWRHVFDQAGGWQVPCEEGTAPDWDLFLRMSGIAPFAPSSMNCVIRKHDRNFSSTKWGRHWSAIHGDVRYHAATITVGLVYSGRVAEMLPRWVETVAASLVKAGKTAHLMILNDSTEDVIAGRLPQGFSGMTVHNLQGPSFDERRANPPLISQFLAGACNRLLREATGDILWIIEDDIMVPVNACQDLLRQILCSQGSPIPAACGYYRSRHSPDRFVLGSNTDGRIIHEASPPTTAKPVQLTGTGCLMILRDLVKGMTFKPKWSDEIRSVNAHDWTFSSDLFDQNRPVIVVPAVWCPHHHDAHSFV